MLAATEEYTPESEVASAALSGEVILADESASGGLVHLPVEVLVPGRYQPRTAFDQAALRRLSESMLKNDLGVIEPLVVRRKAGAGGLYEIVAGERRWRAAQMAGFDRVPCLVRQYDDLQAMVASLTENEDREALNSYERARSYKMAVDEFDLSHEACAGLFRVSRVLITNHLRMFQLPAPVQAHLAAGRLTEVKVRPLHGLAAGDAVRVADEAVELDLTSRQIELKVKSLQAKSAVKPVVKQDPDERLFLDRVGQLLGHPVELEKATGRDAKGGYLKVRYLTNDDLGSITRKLLKGRD